MESSLYLCSSSLRVTHSFYNGYNEVWIFHEDYDNPPCLWASSLCILLFLTEWRKEGKKKEIFLSVVNIGNITLFISFFDANRTWILQGSVAKYLSKRSCVRISYSMVSSRCWFNVSSIEILWNNLVMQIIW